MSGPGGPPEIPGPVPAPSTVPALDGEPEPVGAAGARLLVAATVLAGVAERSAASTVAGWEGATAEAARAAADRLLDRTTALVDALRALAVGLLAHAEELAALAVARAGLVERRRDLARARATLHAELAAALAPAPGRVAAGSAAGGPHAVALLRARAAGLTADVGRHGREVAAWTVRRAAADRTLLAVGPGAAGGGRDDDAHRALAALLGRQAAALLPGGPGADGAQAVPGAAAAWWAGLPDPVRWSLLASAPLLLGRLDGLPPAVRDRGNRLALARDLAVLTARAHRGRLDRGERRRLDLAAAAARALAPAEHHRDPRSGAPVPTLLWDWAPAAHGGDGTAAVSVGDPGAARHVALVVPGLGSDGTDLPARAADARHLWAAARSSTADSVAAVAWIGYDAPDRWASGDLDGWRVAGQGLARAGGAVLAEDVAGLVAGRTTDPHLVVVGHSYGSTTVAHAAAGPGLPADDLVLLGSPGAGPARHAGDLVAGGTAAVWVGSASSDPVTLLGDEGRLGGPGTLGVDPATAGFGAQRFAAEHPDRDLGLRWSPDQHRGYLAPGGESLAAIGLVVAGRPGDVVLAEPRRDPWWRPPVDPEAG